MDPILNLDLGGFPLDLVVFTGNFNLEGDPGFTVLAQLAFFFIKFSYRPIFSPTPSGLPSISVPGLWCRFGSGLVGIIRLGCGVVGLTCGVELGWALGVIGLGFIVGLGLVVAS